MDIFIYINIQKMIERVKLDDELKPITTNKMDIVIGFTTLFLLIFGYLSVWVGGIHMKIFLTILLTEVLLIGVRNKEK